MEQVRLTCLHLPCLSNSEHLVRENRHYVWKPPIQSIRHPFDLCPFHRSGLLLKHPDWERWLDISLSTGRPCVSYWLLCLITQWIHGGIFIAGLDMLAGWYNSVLADWNNTGTRTDPLQLLATSGILHCSQRASVQAFSLGIRQEGRQERHESTSTFKSPCSKYRGDSSPPEWNQFHSVDGFKAEEGLWSNRSVCEILRASLSWNLPTL